MREITWEEAELVNGAFGVPGAVAGAISGGTGYIGTTTGGGNFNTTEFIAAVGGGALLGAIMGPAGVSAAATIGGAGVSFGVGVIGGNSSRLGGGSAA